MAIDNTDMLNEGKHMNIKDYHSVKQCPDQLGHYFTEFQHSMCMSHPSFHIYCELPHDAHVFPHCFLQG